MGRLLTRELVREMAGAIKKRTFKGINEEGMHHQLIGKVVVTRFRGRYLYLNSERVKGIEAIRSDVNYTDIEKFYQELEAGILEFGTLLKNIYNFEETGHKTGISEERHVIVGTTIRERYQTQHGKQEWVSV